MNASAPLMLSTEDKLDVLRYLDEFRFWHSLDDKRRCHRCHEEISGRQVLIYERKGTRGGMRLQCPTPGCASNSSEWFYADPVLAATLKSDFRPRLVLVEKPAPKPQTVYDGQKSRERKRALKQMNVAADKHPLRAAAARLPILRSVVSGLHAIHPVA